MNVKLDLTPSERLILLSLTLKPDQTAAELQSATAVGTDKYFSRILRTLVMSGQVVLSSGIPETYRLGGAK